MKCIQFLKLVAKALKKNIIIPNRQLATPTEKKQQQPSNIEADKVPNLYKKNKTHTTLADGL